MVPCLFSSSLSAGEKDGKTALATKKQELHNLFDQITNLKGHAATIDWGDGVPSPSLTVTIDWGDGTPSSSLAVTNVVARVRWCEDVARHALPNVAAPVGSKPVAGQEVRKYLDQTTPNVTAQAGSKAVADNESPRPQDRTPDELQKIQKANKLIAEYNAKRDAYALEKPNGNYFASLPRLEVDPIELKTNTATVAPDSIGIGQIGRGGLKYAVWVYKSDEGGQWVKQPERTFNTDDPQAAADYVDQVSAVQGWKATSNAPEGMYVHRKLPGRMKSGQIQVQSTPKSSAPKGSDKESLDPNSGAPSGRRISRP